MFLLLADWRVHFIDLAIFLAQDEHTLHTKLFQQWRFLIFVPANESLDLTCCVLTHRLTAILILKLCGADDGIFKIRSSYILVDLSIELNGFLASVLMLTIRAAVATSRFVRVIDTFVFVASRNL